MFVHKAVIRLWMIFRQVDVLIHVECYNMLEGYFILLVCFDQVFVDELRTATRWQSKYEWILR